MLLTRDRVTYIYKGMAAGIMGALVLSAYLLLNIETGWMPALNFISLIGGLTGTGTNGGWVLHFLIGALLGGLFAWLDPDLPGDSLRQRGVVLASVVWLLMMFFLMPLAGHGVFGLNEGVLLPLGALALHATFGIVMGGTYAWLILQSPPIRYRQHRVRRPVQAMRADETTISAEPRASEPAHEAQVPVPPTVTVARPGIPPAPRNLAATTGKTANPVRLRRARTDPPARRSGNSSI